MNQKYIIPNNWSIIEKGFDKGKLAVQLVKKLKPIKKQLLEIPYQN